MSDTIHTTGDLLTSSCSPTKDALDEAAIARLLPLVAGWELRDGLLSKTFDFHDYYDTLAYVNALAYVVHAEDHHPELQVSYKQCQVRFQTHSVHGGRGGISLNDFISAAKADAVYQQSFAGA